MRVLGPRDPRTHCGRLARTRAVAGAWRRGKEPAPTVLSDPGHRVAVARGRPGRRGGVVTGPRRAFAIGAIVGIIGGVVVLEGPPLGAAVLALAAIARPRPATAAGVLGGAGIGMAALLHVATSRCTADSGCSNPDLSGWVVAIAGFLGMGLLLVVLAAWRSTRRCPGALVE